MREIVISMKYLLINVVCGIKSTGRICTDIARELEEKGHTVKIAYGRGTVPEQYAKWAVRITNNVDVLLNVAQSRFLDNTGFGTKYKTKKFLEWIKEYDPDVIHLHNIHGYYINIQLLFEYLKNSGKKIIWTLHDCWAFTGNCGYFEMSKCNYWMNHCKSLPNKYCHRRSWVCRSYRNYEIKKTLFRNVPNMELITPSKWLADRVARSFLSEYPITVKHNTVDSKIYKHIENDFKEKNGITGKFMILGVANVWELRKGLKDFLELSLMLSNQYVIVLVGLDKKQADNIKKKYKNIITITRTDNITELVKIYSAADVFVNPSKEETFGMTTLEAISCGTQAIVYKGTACEEVVDLYQGIPVDEGPKQLYGAITNLFSEANGINR